MAGAKLYQIITDENLLKPMTLFIENVYAKSYRAKMKGRSQNKSLKQTVTRITLFAVKAKAAPRYGGLVPPFYLPYYSQIYL